jgi:hypothetical protein
MNMGVAGPDELAMGGVWRALPAISRTGKRLRLWAPQFLRVCPSHARRLPASRTAGANDVEERPVNDCERRLGSLSPVTDLDLHGAPLMALTATERSRVLRERRAAGKVVLTVVVGEDELAEIARAGYAEAASADRKDREAAVSLFLSDAAWGLTQ